MAKVPSLTIIKNPDEAPAWFLKFLDQLNPFLNDVTKALQGKLSLVENVQAVVGEAEIQTLAASATFRSVVVKVNGFKPQVVLLVKVINTATNRPIAAGPLSYELAETGVKINDLGGLTAASKYKVTILALG